MLDLKKPVTVRQLWMAAAVILIGGILLLQMQDHMPVLEDQTCDVSSVAAEPLPPGMVWQWTIDAEGSMRGQLAARPPYGGEPALIVAE